MKKLGILFLFGLFLALNSFFLSSITANFAIQTSNSYEQINSQTQNRLMPAYCSKRTGCYA